MWCWRIITTILLSETACALFVLACDVVELEKKEFFGGTDIQRVSPKIKCNNCDLSVTSGGSSSEVPVKVLVALDGMDLIFKHQALFAKWV